MTCTWRTTRFLIGLGSPAFAFMTFGIQQRL